MAGNRKTLDTDLIYLREVYARTNFNQTIPANHVLIANGDDSTRWDYLRVSTFNTVIGNDKIPLYADSGLSTLNISTSGPPGLLNSYIDLSSKAIILRSAPPVIAVSQRPVPSPSQIAATTAPDVVSISNYSTITLLGVRDVLFSTVTGVAGAPPAIFMSISSFTSAGYSSISGEAYAWRPYVYDVLRRAQSLPTLTSSIQTTWATGLQNLSTSEAYPNYSTGDVYFSTVSINMSNYIGYIQSGVSQVVLEVEPTYLLPRFLLGNEEYPNLFKNLSSYIQYTNLTSTIILAGSHTSDLIVSQQSNAYTSNYYNKPMKLPIDSGTIASNWAMDGAVGYYTLYHRIPGGMAQLVPGDACGYYVGNRGGMSNDMPTYINATPLENAVFMSIYNKMPFPLTPEELAQQIATSPAPGGFLVLVTTGDQITFSWQGAVGAIDYVLIVNGVTIIPGESQTPFSMFSAFSIPSITAIVSGKSARLSGLMPGTRYPVIVVAIAAGGGRTLSDTVYLVTSPGSPDNLSVSGITNTGFTVSWLNAVGATSYTFTLNGIPATPFSRIGQSAIFTELSPNTTYLFGITAVNSGGETTSAESLPIKTAPDSPEIISSTIGVNRIVIRWQGGEGATSYSYLVNGELTPPESESTFSATFLGLLENTQYNFVVIANGSGGATQSVPYSVSTGGPPTDLSANSITNTSFNITWDGSFDNAVYSYRINDREPSYYDISVNTVNKEGIFTRADPDTVYSIVVIATRDGVASSSPAYSLTTLPNAPTTLVVSPQSITTSGFTLSWIGAVGATSYTYSFNGSLAVPNSTGLNSATFTGLSHSTLYSNIRITARNRGGFAVSDPIFVTTLTPPPTKPVLTVGLRTATSLRIVWQSGTNATSFTYSLNGQGVVPLVFTTTSVTFEGLQANTSYTIRVTGTNITDSATSDPLIVTTLFIPPTAPQITSSAITSSGFTVSWFQDPNVINYTYTLNGNAATPSSSTSTSAIFGGLSADTQYSIIVIANNNNPVSAASNAISLRTLLPPPAAPVPTTSLLTDTSFTVSWPVAQNATSYTYRVNGAESIDAPSRTLSLTGLTPDNSYNIIVTSLNNNTSASSSISVRTLLPPPAAPIPTSSLLTDTSFTFSWPVALNATSYRYSVNGDTAINTSLRSVNLTGLTPDNSYNIIVTSVNNNTTASSSPLFVRTLLPPPAAPVPTTSLLTDTSFTVSWPVAQNATSYKYSVNGAAQIDAPSRTVNLTGLTPNTSYTIVVRAINNNPTVGSASIVVTTLRPPPTAPSITRTQLTDTGFTVSWPLDTNVTSYTYSLNGGSQINTTSSTSTTLTGLTPDTSYNIVVTATNNNTSAVSNRLFITTLLPAPGVPAPTSSLITETSFTVSWPVAQNATGYNYSVNGAEPMNAPSRTVNLTALTPNTPYTIVVRSTNNNPTVGSASILVTTLRTPPAAPSITRTQLTDTGFTVSWPLDTNVTSYTYSLSGGPQINTTTSTSTTLTDLIPDTSYNIVVTATNNNTSAVSNRLFITTLLPRPAVPVPTFSLITENSFTASWPAVPNATSYTYRLGDDPPIDAPSRSITRTGLNANSTYNIRVSATNNNGSSETARLNVTTLRTAPVAFTITSPSRTSSGFRVSWSEDLNVTSYTYTLNDVSAVPVSSNSTSADFGSLNPDTSFNIIVTARNNNPVSRASNTLAIRTLRTQPAAFTVESSNITPTGFTVSWPLDTNVTSYIYRLNGNAATPASSTTTSATFTNQTSNTQYDVVVIARNNNPLSTESSIQLRTVIAPPTNLVASSITPISFTLGWTGSPNANNYKFLIDGNVAATHQLEYTTGATTASFINMFDITLYNVQVIATDGARDSLPSTVLPVTTAALPPPIVFSSSATNLPNSYTIPQGYTNMYVEVLAGSGGGAGGGPQANPSKGGGAGAYIFGTVVVIPGTQVNISDHNILGGARGIASPDGVRTGPPTVGGGGESVVLTYSAGSITVGGGKGGRMGSRIGDNWIPDPNTYTDATGAGGQVTGINPAGLNIRSGDDGPNSTVNGIGANALAVTGSYRGGYAGMANAPAGDFRGNGQAGSNGYYIVRFTGASTRPALTASQIRRNRITVSWPVSILYADYTSSLNGAPTLPTSPTSPTTAEYNDLSANTVYDITIAASRENVPVVSNTLSIRTLLDPPIYVSPSNITGSGFRINWTASSGATNYTFLLNGVSATPTYTAGDLSASFTGLFGSTLYNVSVIATDGTYSSVPSIAVPVTTDLPEPIVFGSSGTALPDNYVVPPGYSHVYVEILTGSGGGAGSGPNARGSFGGGGGAFVFGTTSISPGQTVHLTHKTLTGGAGGLRSVDGTPGSVPTPGATGNESAPGLSQATTLLLGSLPGKYIQITPGRGGNVGTRFGSDWNPAPASVSQANVEGKVETNFNNVTEFQSTGLEGFNGYNGEPSNTDSVSIPRKSGKDGFAWGGYGGKSNTAIGDPLGNGGKGTDGYYIVKIIPNYPTPVISLVSINDGSFVVAWPKQQNLWNGHESLRLLKDGTPSGYVAVRDSYGVYVGIVANTSYTLVLHVDRNIGGVKTTFVSNTLNVRSILVAPTGLSTSDVTSSSFTFNWNASLNAPNYTFLVNRALVPVAGVTVTYTAGQVNADGKPTASFTGLSPSTYYMLQVIAIDGIYKSEPSLPISVLTSAS